MPKFDRTGWEKISNPCEDCGEDECYIKPTGPNTQDIKQFHKRSCRQIPSKLSPENLPNITDVEFKEIK